jgi:hypothetical protein
MFSENKSSMSDKNLNSQNLQQEPFPYKEIRCMLTLFGLLKIKNILIQIALFTLSGACSQMKVLIKIEKIIVLFFFSLS